MINLPAFIQHSTTKRTSALSEGSKLCAIILAICAAPLFVVSGWMAVWLLTIITIVGLGTFGLWFFKDVTGKNKPTEEHTENMAAIALFGQNRDGKSPLLQSVDQSLLGSNPETSDAQESDRG